MAEPVVTIGGIAKVVGAITSIADRIGGRNRPISGEGQVALAEVILRNRPGDPTGLAILRDGQRRLGIQPEAPRPGVAFPPGQTAPPGRTIPPEDRQPRPPTKAEQKMTSGPFGIPKAVFRRIPARYQRVILIVWDRLPPEAQKRIRDGVVKAARTVKGAIKIYIIGKILQREGIEVPDDAPLPGPAPTPRPRPPVPGEYGGIPYPTWPGPPVRLPQPVPVPQRRPVPQPRQATVPVPQPVPVPVPQPVPQPVPVPQRRPVPQPLPPLPPLPPAPRGPTPAQRTALDIARQLARRLERPARPARAPAPGAPDLVPQVPAQLAPATTRLGDLTRIEAARRECIDRCEKQKSKPRRKRKVRTECRSGTYTETATGRRLRPKRKVPCK